MSLHNVELTPAEEAGLSQHRLPIGKPSQLSDCFRIGMAYSDKIHEAEIAELKAKIAELNKMLDWAALPF